MKINALKLMVLAATVIWAVGCDTTPPTQADRQELHTDANAAMDTFKQTDPSLDPFLRNAYGYVIFPSIGKGGAIVGGAYGHGNVYEQGQFVGYADVTQGTFGAQLGGQSYAELIVFQDKTALENFKSGSLFFDANASAVAANSGAAASVKYQNGVAVFVKTNGGLMAEATIGGQKFSFAPANGSSTMPTEASTMPAPSGMQ